jgi:transcriptional regulator with GAF, ATPase, and Fis domain
MLVPFTHTNHHTNFGAKSHRAALPAELRAGVRGLRIAVLQLMAEFAAIPQSYSIERKIGLAHFRSAGYTVCVEESAGPDGYLDIDFLHELSKRLSSAPLSEVLARIVRFISDFVKSDSCFIYIREGNELILRASSNPHKDAVGKLGLRVGQGITGWVAQHKKPVAIPRNAFDDPRFQSFSELPEDRFHAILSVPVICREKVVGVINVQHRKVHIHSRRDIQLISVIGYLMGAEVELARLEGLVGKDEKSSKGPGHKEGKGAK